MRGRFQADRLRGGGARRRYENGSPPIAGLTGNLQRAVMAGQNAALSRYPGSLALFLFIKHKLDMIIVQVLDIHLAAFLHLRGVKGGDGLFAFNLLGDAVFMP